MISLIVALVIMGLLLYLLGFIPMDPAILQIIRVVVIICAVLYVVRVLFPGALALP